jgi:hypothetical protein
VYEFDQEPVSNMAFMQTKDKQKVKEVKVRCTGTLAVQSEINLVTQVCPEKSGARPCWTMTHYRSENKKLPDSNLSKAHDAKVIEKRFLTIEVGDNIGSFLEATGATQKES